MNPIKKFSRLCVAASILILVLCESGCSQQQKDKDIKQMINSNAKQEIGFADLNYTVHNGVVTVNGNCPTQQQKEKVLSRIKNTNGVKGVVDEIQIAPVLLGADYSLKLSVDSVLTQYANVAATVQDSVITLQGSIENKQLHDLLKSLTDLHPKGLNQHVKINNQP